MTLWTSNQDPGSIAVSVVVPAFNEARTVDAHLRLLVDWLHGLPWTSELIVVDDGSTDRTAEIIHRWTEQLPALRLISLLPNQGRGAALRAGINAARGRIVLTTEADLSWSFQCLELLIDRVASGTADIAIASPHGDGGGMQGVPLFRVAISRCGNTLAGAVLGSGITMATGMTRAYRADILHRALSPKDGKEFHLDVLTRAIRCGASFCEVPAVIRWRNPAERRQRLPSLFVMARTIAIHLGLLGRHALGSWHHRLGRS